jgi:hypothetical protein
MVAVIYLHALHPMLPLPARRDPTARNAGWEMVARTVDSTRASLSPVSKTPTIWVGADRYQDVSELAYHLRAASGVSAARPAALCVCLSGRRNQYDLWPGFPSLARTDDALVLVLDESAELHPTAARLAPYFTSVVRGAPAPLLRGADTVSVRRVWTLTGYRGGWPSRAEP